MTDHSDLTAHNDLMPAQEKLEWVTPKISLMEAGDTQGKGKNPYPLEDDPDAPFGGSVYISGSS
jgi:hypothetical protein